MRTRNQPRLWRVFVLWLRRAANDFNRSMKERQADPAVKSYDESFQTRRYG